jgi:hypothetical protein
MVQFLGITSKSRYLHVFLYKGYSRIYLWPMFPGGTFLGNFLVVLEVRIDLGGSFSARANGLRY